MKKRTFPVAPDLPTWRLMLGLTLVFLPFSALAAFILVATLTAGDETGAWSLSAFFPAAVTLISAGVVHELGHWLASGPGSKVSGIITTPGLATVRLRLEPELVPGSPRWALRMTGGSLTNLLVAAGCVLAVRLFPEVSWSSLWLQGVFAFHLMTGLVNLVPFRTGFSGASDGWLLWDGFRQRLREKNNSSNNT